VSFLGYLLAIALSGLLVGSLARLALPGKDPLSLGQTMLVGIAGSLAAGLVAYAIGVPQLAGITGGILCATTIMYFIRRSRGGGLTHPGGPPENRPGTGPGV